MVDRAVLFQRWKRLIRHFWKKEYTITKVNCLICVVGDEEHEAMNGNSAALMKWLFGCEIKNTVIIFKNNALHILIDQNSWQFFHRLTMKKNDEKESITINLHIMNDDYDYEKDFRKLAGHIKSSDGSRTIVAFVKNNCDSDIVQAWQELLESRYKKVDVSNDIAYVMSAKDKFEIDTMKIACSIAREAMGYLVNSIMYACYSLENFEFISQRAVADELIEALMYHNSSDGKSRHCFDKRLDSPKFINQVGTILIKNRKKNRYGYPIKICYYPIIKSGSAVYSSEFDVENDNNTIQAGFTTFSVGIQYNGYCCNITRTMLFDSYPYDSIKKNHAILLQIQELILEELKPGVALREVYSTVIRFVTDTRPDLLKHLAKNFGSAIGIKFKENSLSISPETPAKAQEGMTFNLSVALSNLRYEEPNENSTYTLWIADTCLVEKDKSILLSNFGQYLLGRYF